MRRASSSGQQIAEVFEHAVDAALQREADDDVGAVGGGQMRDDVRQQRVVAAGDQVPRRRGRRLTCQVVRAARDDVADAAAWIGDVAGIAGNDVEMQVRDGLARGLADVDPDIEAAFTVLLPPVVPR